jgi:hypothetical protein
LTVSGKLKVLGLKDNLSVSATQDNIQIWSDGSSGYIQSNGDLNGLKIKSNTAGVIILESNVGIGTSSTRANLEVSGTLKLQSGARVNEFSNNASLGTSETVVPTQKAVRAYAETKAKRNGDIQQDFSVKKLLVVGNDLGEVMELGEYKVVLGSSGELSLRKNSHLLFSIKKDKIKYMRKYVDYYDFAPVPGFETPDERHITELSGESWGREVSERTETPSPLTHNVGTPPEHTHTELLGGSLLRNLWYWREWGAGEVGSEVVVVQGGSGVSSQIITIPLS